MNNRFASIKLNGLFSYLLTRAKLRFLGRSGVGEDERIFEILGESVALDIRDLEQKYLAADCVREPENLIVYRAIASSGMVNTFIDIGANCGHVALSIIGDYKNVLLFEPNPKLAVLLREVFKNQRHVTVSEVAIVDAESVGSLTLTVPDDSSGLATLGATSLSSQHSDFHTYDVKASTLEAETKDFSIADAYIKIDVEGFESNIIESARDLINKERPIVGFEALSKSAALKCVSYFQGYVFYCARFGFLEEGGALSKSAANIAKALIIGGEIEIIRIDKFEDIKLSNFSQVYSVPKEKSDRFERMITEFTAGHPVLALNVLRTWN